MKLSMKQNIGIIVGVFVFFSGIIQGVTPYTGEDQWGNILREADQKHDQAEAVKLYEQVAQDFNAVPCARAYAKLQLGTRYFDGSYGLTQNYGRARELYEDVVNILEKATQKDTACLQNQAEAWLKLGKLYSFYHVGVSKNLGKGKQLLEKAAKQMVDLSTQAQANLELGYVYCCAQDSADLKQAREWFEKAANQKANPFVQAQAWKQLALIYSETKYNPDEIRGALENVAGNPNNAYLQASAWRELGRFYWDGKLVPRDLKRAKEYFEKVVNQATSSDYDLLAAQGDLGEVYYEQGDFSKALEFLDKANKQMLDSQVRASAQVFLGKMYLYGHGVAKDAEKALVLLNQAADEKSHNLDARVLARLQLAEIYAKGLGGVEKNLKKARELYEQVQGQEFDLPSKIKATVVLGEMHLRGLGVPKVDIVRAQGLLNEAKTRVNALLKKQAVGGFTQEQLKKVLTEA
ncbi:tetratricopeptide repeat protein, partial [Methylicorpusculum sp.]|uniref:tetratricopeptide repeat protein n=1 Tax=Methylicorpusculum sp. TaxID=2713644 RepID=UPI002ABAA372